MKLAQQVVEKCLGVTDKDNVTILVSRHAIPLAEEMATECFRKGADVLLNLYTDTYQHDYFKYLSVDSLKQPSAFCRALSEYSTVEIFFATAENPQIFRDVPADKQAASSEGETKAHLPISRERKIRSLGIGLTFVTRPRAKTYGFSFEKWKKATAAASNVDYGKLQKAGRKLKESVSNAQAVHVSGKNGTDITFDIGGCKWKVSDGVIDEEDVREENLNDNIPSGSILALPRSANGRIVFNTKVPLAGRSIGRMEYEFEDGLLTDFSGDSSTKFVKEFYEKSDGDKDKIATLTLGFNPKAVPGFMMNNIVSGAVAVGVGGNEFNGGTNKSSYFFEHTLTGASIEADGKALVKNGTLLL